MRRLLPEKHRRRARAWGRRFLERLVAAVVAFLAVYGAWQLGTRLAEAAGEARAGWRPERREGPAAVERREPAAPAEGRRASEEPAPPETAERAEVEAGAEAESDDVRELRRRRLLIPVVGVERAELRDSFDDMRGSRRHRAIDIMAPRFRPVRAVQEGTVARLFESQRGGTTIYQYGPEGRYVFYYAHLESYAPGLSEGARVARGQIIGYVGSSGNAAADAPHLHFAIERLEPGGSWWNGEPINPYPVLR